MKNNKLKTFAICGLSVAILTACGQKDTTTEETKLASTVAIEKVENIQKQPEQANLVIDNKTKNGLAVIEGEHYKKLKAPVQVEGLEDYSVLEIFWLGCPHCQNFEEGVRNWKPNKAEGLQLKKMHAVSQNPRWIMDAHIYTTFEKLSNNNEKVMEGLFDLYIAQFKEYKAAIEKDKKTSVKGTPSFKLIQEYAVASNISAEDFSATFQSEETKAEVSKAGEEFVKAELSGVPAFIVNKEYMITGKDAKSYEDYFQIVEKVAELTKK